MKRVVVVVVMMFCAGMVMASPLEQCASDFFGAEEKVTALEAKVQQLEADILQMKKDHPDIPDEADVTVPPEWAQ